VIIELTLKNEGAEFFVPDQADIESSLKRTTHMTVSAHQDDIEIMAYNGIMNCFGNHDQWFFGVVATDGAGSPCVVSCLKLLFGLPYHRKRISDKWLFI
jgi:hypothetical protein